MRRVSTPAMRDARAVRTQALDALQAEAEQRIDVSRLVVAAKQVHILRVLDLERGARGSAGARAEQRARADTP